LVSLIVLLSSGCQSEPRRSLQTIGESLVLGGTEPGKLLFAPVRERGVIVRSTYLPGGGGATYEAGKDYVVDAHAGTIARTPTSRIPDFATNVLYGKADFDHSKFPGYGNLPFTVYVDYESDAIRQLAQPVRTELLPNTAKKLREGQSLKIISFGDSITAGGEASQKSLQYPERYADELRRRFPKATIEVENGATGGDTTREGLQRLEVKVLTRKPDLVLVAFGMNDHNIGGTPIPEFKANLKQMIDRIRSATGAETMLLSTFPPNPKWHFSSHRMEQYATATKETADEAKVTYVDVFDVWQSVLQRKDPPSLLANHINHPNDFGHWLYLEALKAVQF
jgi:lysophospholipase L1-like esterase